jgi:hypothetical protein
MKKYILSAICLATFGLGAAEFQHKISIKPVTSETGEQTYLAQVQIEKTDDNAVATVVAKPEIVCVEGTWGKVEQGSAEEADHLLVTVLVFKDNEELKAKAKINLKEENKEVLAVEQDVVINNS